MSKRTNRRGYNVLNTLKHSQIIYAFRYHLPGALTNLELSPVVKGIIKEDTYRNGITYNRIFRINKKGEPGREMCSWAWFLFETEAEANDAYQELLENLTTDLNDKIGVIQTLLEKVEKAKV